MIPVYGLPGCAAFLSGIFSRQMPAGKGLLGKAGSLDKPPLNPPRTGGIKGGPVKMLTLFNSPWKAGLRRARLD
jgi:hypothetical protein